MKIAALAALLLVLFVPSQAQALDTDELLGLVAMPLAVAAVSETTGVPVSELSHFVATLNRANVPPTQIVQVVRYAPAALVIEDQQPTFVQYVDYQVEQGVTGTRLVTVIEERYRTYDLEPQFYTFDEPATTWVVREDYVPEVVVTRMAEYRPAYVVGDTNDLLALAAMPLAVAAVAEMTGVPFADLSSLVASFNAARMPAYQVVEVLRYSPVVLVDDYERPRFVQFVNAQVVDGLSGPRLINVIDDRLRTYDVTPRLASVQVRDVMTVVDRDDFFPPAVTSRVAEVRAHPHGGPPGQLKKERGLKTGAEVVHDTRVAREPRVAKQQRIVQKPAKQVRVAQPRVTRTQVEKPRVEKPRVEKQPKIQKQPKADRQPKIERQNTAQPKPERAQRGKANAGQDKGNAQGKDNGQGKGKGKGKG
jgi:hypothetical protein